MKPISDIVFKVVPHIKYKITAAVILFMFMGFVTVGWAQTEPLSIDEAIKTALQKDPGIESANWDWLSASAKADEANWRKFPSLSLSASYQRLSELPPASVDFPTGPTTPPMHVTFPASLTDIYTLSVNLQYPIFAGFRIRETAAIAELQAQNKLLALEMVKRSLVFEVRRAYWEAVRATDNVETLKKNLELMRAGREITAQQAAQGTATQADLLYADMRSNQAEIDLEDAVSLEKRAYLVLASLVGKNASDYKFSTDSSNTSPPFTLSTRPEDSRSPAIGEVIDENKLISLALAQRPETRISAVSLQMAEHSVRLAEAGLYPTLTITGNVSLADPNPRVAFQTDPTIFTGTWALGVQLSYDLGGLPANIDEKIAQDRGAKKTQADAQKQFKTVVLDVRTCILNLERARRDLSLTKGMVNQAKENVRVVQQKYDAGTTTKVDLLGAQLALLRMEFAVTNKEIDVQIASADLARAVALEEMN